MLKRRLSRLSRSHTTLRIHDRDWHHRGASLGVDTIESTVHSLTPISQGSMISFKTSWALAQEA